MREGSNEEHSAVLHFTPYGCWEQNTNASGRLSHSPARVTNNGLSAGWPPTRIVEEPHATFVTPNESIKPNRFTTAHGGTAASQRRCPPTGTLETLGTLSQRTGLGYRP